MCVRFTSGPGSDLAGLKTDPARDQNNVFIGRELPALIDFRMLERVEEIHEILLFLYRQANIEALVIEINDIAQCCRRPIGEIGCVCRQGPQRWHRRPADIGAFASDQSLARIIGEDNRTMVNGGCAILTGELENRQRC